MFAVCALVPNVGLAEKGAVRLGSKSSRTEHARYLTIFPMTAR